LFFVSGLAAMAIGYRSRCGFRMIAFRRSHIMD
jgi:hypothetical protein